jgi:membrane-bound serine protease (ClpP class)
LYVKHFCRYSILILAVVMQTWGLAFGQNEVVKVLTLESAITPVSAEYLIKAINQAEYENAECIVIQLDTPGGLMTSMEDIIKEILGSQIPVVVYVAPSGAKAGSAGVFITISAHISAMAPATNIGAAHPVSLGSPIDTASVMQEKITNDAAAYARSLAEKRGKNVEWAEQAVRESVSITANEALELGVIDIIAPTLDSLLTLIDGREIEVALGTKILKTKNARIEKIELGIRYQILSLIVDPNIAYILMMLGMAGVMLELYNPGSIFPGVIGGVSLILAFYAMQTLPVNYAGLLLMALAVVMFILEVKVTSFGMLSVGGIIALTIGSVMLFESPDELMRVSWSVIIPTVLMTALFFIFAVGLAIQAQNRRPTTGTEGLLGEIGIARTSLKKDGQILLHGEIWTATSDQAIKKGDRVKVISVDHLEVKVEKV